MSLHVSVPHSLLCKMGTLEGVSYSVEVMRTEWSMPTTKTVLAQSKLFNIYWPSGLHLPPSTPFSTCQIEQTFKTRKADQSALLPAC